MKTLHSRYKLLFLFVCFFIGGISVHARPRPMRMSSKRGMNALSVSRRYQKEAPRTRVGRRLRERLKRKVEMADARTPKMSQKKRVINHYTPSRLHRGGIYAKTLNQKPSSKKANNQGSGFNVSRVFSSVYLLATTVGVLYLVYKAWKHEISTNLSDNDNFSKTLTYKLSAGKANSSPFINYLLCFEKSFHTDAFYPWINVLPFPCLLSLSLVSAAIITFVLWTGYNMFIGSKNRVIPASSYQSINLDINPDIHISSPSAKSSLQQEGIKAFIKESVRKGVKEGMERIKQQIKNTKDDLKEIKEKLDQKKGRVIHIYPNSVVTEAASNEKGVQAVDDDNTVSQPVDTIAIPVEDDEDDFLIEEDEDDEDSDLEDEEEDDDEDDFLIEEDEDNDLEDEEEDDDEGSDVEDEEDEGSDLGDEEGEDEDDYKGKEEDSEDDDDDEDFVFLSAFSRT